MALVDVASLKPLSEYCEEVGTHAACLLARRVRSRLGSNRSLESNVPVPCFETSREDACDEAADLMSQSESDDEPGESTYYDVLYCAPDADETQLRQAYKQQALHWHPDKNSDPEAEERFKLINTAWSVLSDSAKRAAYDRRVLHGEHDEGQDASHEYSAAVAREAWQAFMKADELQRRTQARRERSLVIGVCSLVLSAVGLLLLLWNFAGDSILLFPPPLELRNDELSRFPLDLDFKRFSERLTARHTSRLPKESAAWLAYGARFFGAYGPSLLRTHTPYLRLLLNRTSEIRRAPTAGGAPGRGYLLKSAHDGEDIYGRPINLVSNTYLFLTSERPTTWPAVSVCVRLLRSGGAKHKEWWDDMSRAVGGRLRPIALAVAPNSECQPEFGLPVLALTTTGALLAATLAVRLLA